MNLLKKTMDTYHDMPSRPNLVIDNNRAWCSNLQLLSIMRLLEKELNVPATTYDMDNVRYTPPTAYDKALETPGLHSGETEA